MIDPRWLQEYWLREEDEDDPFGIRRPEPEPYEYGLTDADTQLLPDPGAKTPGLKGWESGAATGAGIGGKILGGLGAKIGGGLGGAIGGLGAALGPIGLGLGVVSTVAGMIGRKKAEKEQEEEQERAEALRRVAFMSQNRERAVGRWR